jgi:hypothetical protein
VEEVKALIKFKVNVNAKAQVVFDVFDFSLIMCERYGLSHRNHKSIFFFFFQLIHHKKDMTALMAASSNGEDEVVRLLLAVPGIDVNCKDDDVS